MKRPFVRQGQSRRPAQPLVALAFSLAVPHLARVLRGILNYACQHTRWRFATSERNYCHLAELAGWDGDGVIGLAVNSRDIAAAHALDCPVVNCSGSLAAANLPRVRPDYFAAGTLAAEHLLDRCFRRFAFYGIQDLFYSQQLKAGFVERLGKLGFPVSALETAAAARQSQPWRARREKLEKWLQQLQAPVGLFCAEDMRAAAVIEACHWIGLRVPHDVAVIGYDNDETCCELCDPPLTSIDRRDEEVGFEAARLLDALMAGRGKRTIQEVVVPPGPVLWRASTGTVSVEHSVLRKAVEFMHQHYARGVGVEDVAAHCGRSRRWLELRARGVLPGTLLDYLNSLRVRKARALLAAGGDLLLKDVARECGFSSAKHLTAVLHRQGATKWRAARQRS
ncbi:MAG: substrate-binding domain-containing protein [Verrucomicrobiia bacterium]